MNTYLRTVCSVILFEQSRGILYPSACEQISNLGHKSRARWMRGAVERVYRRRLLRCEERLERHSARQ